MTLSSLLNLSWCIRLEDEDVKLLEVSLRSLPLSSLGEARDVLPHPSFPKMIGNSLGESSSFLERHIFFLEGVRRDVRVLSSKEKKVRRQRFWVCGDGGTFG